MQEFLQIWRCSKFQTYEWMTSLITYGIVYVLKKVPIGGKLVFSTDQILFSYEMKFEHIIGNGWSYCFSLE